MAEKLTGTAATPLLRVVGLSKTFGTDRALDDVSFELFAGEIVALVGQNGSGKSTLVKVLAGFHEADPGGRVDVRDPGGRLVEQRGQLHPTLHFIHQDLGLLPTLSTVENLDLARALGARGLRPTSRMEDRRAAALLERFGIRIDVRAPVGTLSAAEQAIVAIARALDGWTRRENVLVLDEPTAAFHSTEVERVFEAVRRVAAEGAGVIYISHRLDEVRALADRVIALRDGRKVAEVVAGEVDDEALIAAIVGPTVVPRAAHAFDTQPRVGNVVLKVDHLSGRRLSDVSLTAGRGEIVGIAGVLGSGREELGSVLFGAGSRRGGTVTVGGAPLQADDIGAAIEHGVGFVPVDRHRSGAVMTMSVAENLTLPATKSLRLRGGRLDLAHERAEAVEWSTRLDVRPVAPEKMLNQFSGGNQQKVVLAKWLRTRPRVLLMDEPTQGVDVGAKATVHGLIRRAAADGTAVVLSSSDVKELATVCDRVIVMQGGKVATELQGDELTDEMLLRATLGTSGAGGAEGTAELPGARGCFGVPSRWERLRRGATFSNASALYIFAILFVVFSVWEPSTFLTSQTWRLLLDNQAISAIVAIGLIIPLSAGVVDLAIGSEVGLGAILVAWLLVNHGLPVPIAIGCTLLAGAAVGVVMTGLIVKARIFSFVAALAMSSILLAMIDWISGGEQIVNLPASFQDLATGELLGVAYPVWMLAVVSIAVWYVLARTPFGRHVYATGGNIEAARLAGVRTGRVILISTVACGVIAAVAGILQSGQLATGDPTISTAYLLPAFAATFLGSTQFSRGRFNVAGTLVAVLVLAVGVQGLELAGAASWLPNLFDGVALLLAVGVAQMQRAPGSRTAAIRRVLRLIGPGREAAAS